MEQLRSYFRSLSAAGKRDFAKSCGVQLGYIRKMLSPSAREDGKLFSESLVLKFEHFSRGRVKKESLLPDADWSYLRGKRYRPRGSAISGSHG